MFNRKHLRFLIFSLFGVLIAFAYLARKPLCIDSKLVERIDRISSQGTTQAYSCSAREFVPYDDVLALIIPSLESRLLPIARILEDLKAEISPLKIVILDKNEPIYRINDSTLYISQILINQPNTLEKAIVKTWFQKIGLQNDLYSESFSDLFLSWLESSNSDFENMEKNHWPSVIKNLKDYCLGASVSFEHLSLCSKQDSENPFLNNELVPLSLRPLLSAALKQSYSELSPTDRFLFTRKFGKFVRTLSVELNKDSKPSVEIENKKEPSFSITSLSEILLLLTNSVSAVAGDSVVNSRFAKALQLQIQRLGVTQAPDLALFDILILIENEELLRTNLTDLKKLNLNESLAVENNNKIIILPDESEISRQVFRKIKAKKAIYLGCGTPSAERLVDWASRFDKLLIANVCDSSKKIGFRGYLRDGVESFARENQGISFIQFHLPSLVQAWKDQTSNPISMVASQSWKSELFLKMGWQEPVLNKKLNYFKTNSVIEAIEAFRPEEQRN